MVYYAADMKLESGQAPFTNFMLSCISVLDNMGAWEWNLRYAALVWFVFFAAIRHGIGKTRGVEWYALVHAIITGVGGVVCAYLSYARAEDLIGVSEPLHMVLCGGPITSLHRVLPTAALGYAVLDLVDGLALDISFMTHGIALFSFALYMSENDKNEILAIMLALEFSSIFFNFTRADFLTPNQSLANLIIFVITFFLCRVVFGPWSSWQIVKLLYTEALHQDNIGCHPTGFRHFISVQAVVFNVLNLYWFVKIIQKLQRKLKGESKADQLKKKNATTNNNNGVKMNGHSNGYHHKENGSARKED